MDGALWDLGWPDPPFSQYLDEQGAQSISRRILPVNTGLVRKRTRCSYLFMRGTAVPGVWDVFEAPSAHTSAGQVVLGTVEISLPAVTLYDPYDREAFTITPGGGVLQQLDRSRDGRKWLMASVGGTPGANTDEGSFFTTLVFTVEFTLQPDDTWTWETTIIADLQQCIGSFDIVRTVNAKGSRLTLDQAGLEDTFTFSSTERISLTYDDGSVSNGTYSQTLTRTGMVLGGWFLASGAVELLYADYEFYDEQDVSLAGSFSSKSDPEDDDFDLQHWRIASSKRRGLDVTLRAGSGSVELEYEITENRTFSLDEEYDPAGPSGPGVYNVGSVDYITNENIHGTPATYEFTATQGPYVVGFGGTQPGINASPALPTGRLWAPLRMEMSRAMTLRRANTQCNKAVAMVGGGLAGGVAPWWLTEALTPSGPMGAPVETGGGSSERCTYNPITGELARQADLPDGQNLVGWL